jgi:hypothetical protein
MIACRATTHYPAAALIFVLLCDCRVTVMHAPGVSVDGRSIDECVL